MSRSYDIEPYSTIISYKSNKTGSGLLLKTDRSCYLITAKHNFKNMFSKHVSLKEIEITRHNEGKICDISNIVYEQDDLIVFSLRYIGEYIDDLDTIEVLEDTPTDDHIDYFFYGYPNMKPKGNFIDKLRSRQKTSDDYIFSLKNDDENATQYIEGFSGSGVFIQDGILCYLTGIVLQSKDDYHLINVFDLPKIIKNINNSLEYHCIEKIRTNQMDGERTGTNLMYKMIINRNPHNYLVKKVVETFGSDLKLEELAYDNEKLSVFVEKMKLRRLKKIEQSYQRELADTYLLASFITKENGNNKRSNNLVVKSMGYKKAFIRYHDNPKKYKGGKEKNTSNYFSKFIKYITFFIIAFLIYTLFQ